MANNKIFFPSRRWQGISRGMRIKHSRFNQSISDYQSGIMAFKAQFMRFLCHPHPPSRCRRLVQQVRNGQTDTPP
jgi:hypothetical protein